MRRASTVGAERLEWNGESLEREVIMSASSAAATHRGRDKRRKSRGDLADLKEGQVFSSPTLRRMTPLVLGDSVITGEKSPVPRRAEAVEQGLLAMKLRGLKVERDRT